MGHHIIASCRFCGETYRVKRSAAGKRARCKVCGEVFQVPELGASLDDTVVQWLLEDQARETRRQDTATPSMTHSLDY